MRTMLCALALLLGLGMAAAPARAQDEHDAMMQMHQRELGLTPAQMERLTAIHASLAATMRAHCERVRAAGGPNEQTHAAMHGEMTAAMESAHRQAMEVLTPEQRVKMDSLHAAHHGAAAEHDMAAMHAGHDMSAMHAEHGAEHDSTEMAKMHAASHGEGGMCAADPPASTATPRPRR
jgi:hypothetical protein